MYVLYARYVCVYLTEPCEDHAGCVILPIKPCDTCPLTCDNGPVCSEYYLSVRWHTCDGILWDSSIISMISYKMIVMFLMSLIIAVS